MDCDKKCWAGTGKKPTLAEEVKASRKKIMESRSKKRQIDDVSEIRRDDSKVPGPEEFFEVKRFDPDNA